MQLLLLATLKRTRVTNTVFQNITLHKACVTLKLEIPNEAGCDSLMKNTSNSSLIILLKI